MIATILPGSTNFHAVGYNEHKVSKEAVEALSQMTAPQTNVLRDGKIGRAHV